jgi:Icc protein
MKKVTRRGFIQSALALSILPLGLSAKEERKQKEEKSLKLIHITDSHMDLADEESIEAM